MHENEIAKLVLDAAFKIHKEVGPGLLESVYEELLAFELEKNWFICKTDKSGSHYCTKA